MKTKLMKRVEKPSDVPTGKHYAVIEFREVTEASGWGPENDSTVSAPHYYVTEDRDAWEAHIRACEHDKRTPGFRYEYVALVVESKAKIERPVVIG